MIRNFKVGVLLLVSSLACTARQFDTTEDQSEAQNIQLKDGADLSEIYSIRAKSAPSTKADEDLLCIYLREKNKQGTIKYDVLLSPKMISLTHLLARRDKSDLTRLLGNERQIYLSRLPRIVPNNRLDSENEFNSFDVNLKAYINSLRAGDDVTFHRDPNSDLGRADYDHFLFAEFVTQVSLKYGTGACREKNKPLTLRPK